FKCIFPVKLFLFEEMSQNFFNDFVIPIGIPACRQAGIRLRVFLRLRLEKTQVSLKEKPG
ncbi:MAG: hypothetical protein KAS99_00655, partial [Candidatus Omnitrophica bacterium]|nr:hypothetical protein [Candidatus Omnitrophota bacterium]